MDFNTAQGLFGNPYVGWSPRPAKNGQPPPCYGQCNLNIGARKVGAALRRYPQIFMGPKAKEQILQKWDPVSGSLVNIHQRGPPPPPQTIITIINQAAYLSAGEDGSLQYSLRTNQADTIIARLYDNGTANFPINGSEVGTSTPTYNIIPSEDISSSIDISGGNSISGHFYYFLIIPSNGPLVISNLFLCE